MAPTSPTPTATDGTVLPAGAKGTRTPSGPPAFLRTLLLSRALELGFDDAGIAGLAGLEEHGRNLEEFLASGYHGDMAWMASRQEERSHPARYWPPARSALVVGLGYAPAGDPRRRADDPARGAISVYADRRDYHEVMKPRLRELARLAAGHGVASRPFADTAPVMEKPLAEAAGLGWRGRHTCLVSRRLGSWLFLGGLLLDVALPADPPRPGRCGSCRRCLDACPTNAFPAPWQLDARRCLAYLTIEHRGQIPVEFREPMGNRVFGCDDCLAVCPWNRFARASREQALRPRSEIGTGDLVAWAGLCEKDFRAMFRATPVRRLGRERFLRNVAIALGNSRDIRALPALGRLAADGPPLAKEAADWAISGVAAAAVTAGPRQ